MGIFLSYPTHVLPYLGSKSKVEVYMSNVQNLFATYKAKSSQEKDAQQNEQRRALGARRCENEKRWCGSTGKKREGKNGERRGGRFV
jgi:hypothetical protein